MPVAAIYQHVYTRQHVIVKPAGGDTTLVNLKKDYNKNGENRKTIYKAIHQKGFIKASSSLVPEHVTLRVGSVYTRSIPHRKITQRLYVVFYMKNTIRCGEHTDGLQRNLPPINMAPKHDSKMGYGSTSYQNEETAIEVPQDKPPPQTSTVPFRSLTLSYILACPLGILGLHHFYLGRHRFGVLYLCTGGMLMMGWILDLVRMPCLVRQTNRRLQGQQDTRFRDPQDAYMMLLPPFGLLGE